MKKSYWTIGAVLLLCAVGAMAATEAPSEYWLGIGCAPLSAPLRAQLKLPENQGILVQEIAPDSPAAKAGIVEHDVLLRAGEKVLTEPHDLVAVIEATKDGTLKIELLRGGKPVVVEATPAKRPEGARVPEAQAPAPGDREMMERWMQGVLSNENNGQRPSAHWRFFHPGAIVPRDAIPAVPLPPNTTITLSKEGDQPIKIVVTRGDEKWEVTEKELDKLPADIRPYVERIIGRGPLGIVGGLRAFDFAPDVDDENGLVQEGATPDQGVAAPHGHAWFDRLEKRFDEMDRRMEKMMMQMDQFLSGRVQGGSADQRQEK